MKIRFFKWVVTAKPIREKDIPDKWQVATSFYILGKEFMLWEL
jgi:hypothetical protein